MHTFLIKNHIGVIYDGSYEKHQVIPECDVPEGILSNTEIEVLNRIYEKFKSFGSIEISEYSHKEKGYMQMWKRIFLLLKPSTS